MIGLYLSHSNFEPNKFLSFLEGASRSDRFFLLTTFTILVDSALIHIHGHGLIFFVANPDLIKLSFGLELYLIFVFFSFLMSLVMPFINYFSSQYAYIFWLINDTLLGWIIKKLSFQNNDSESFRRPYNCVLISEIENKFCNSMDNYYIDLYQSEEIKINKKYSDDFKYRSIVGSCCAAGFFNFIFSGNESLLNYGAILFGGEIFVWGGLLMMFALANNYLFLPHETNWIKCPPLYKEIIEAEQKKISPLPPMRRN